MATNVELYEVLKERIGREAALMLAESIPRASDLATKADLVDLKSEIGDLRMEMRVGFEQIRTELKGVENRLMRWMLTFFVPLWLGVWAVVLGLVLAR